MSSSTQKFAAVVSYKGTRYCGWQRQRGSAAAGNPSIQETIEKALSKITSEKVAISASGRTDAGVHATGQVMHFKLERKEWDPNKLRLGLGSLLPADIRILALVPVALEFHAQRSAVKKQYSFYFQQGPTELPHLSSFSWWIRKPLDLDSMRTALGHLVGEHDFLPFRASGAAPGTTIRTILEASLQWQPIGFPERVEPGFGLVRMTVVGTGFLKQMVRGIAGTLLEVGEGRAKASCTVEILEKKDRSLVGATAAPRGLWLEKVWYPEGLFSPFGD